MPPLTLPVASAMRLVGQWDVADLAQAEALVHFCFLSHTSAITMKTCLGKPARRREAGGQITFVTSVKYQTCE